MLFFLRSWCYFRSSDVALLVSMSKFKHLEASELQRSTRFPFHCQDRFLLWFKWGSENEVEKSVEKVVPKGPQLDPKSCQESIEACSGGVSKRDLKNGPSPGSGKVRFCSYLLQFSKVGGLKKDTFFGTILGPFGRQNRWKLGSRTSSKKVLKIDTHFTRFWVDFGDHFWVKSRSFAGRRWVWHVDP